MRITGLGERHPGHNVRVGGIELEFPGRNRDTIGEEFKRKEARYKKLWGPRFGSQMAALPPFDDVIRSVAGRR